MTQGLLYFLRERDLVTDKLSAYVKIGLVKGDGAERDTAKRIKEHQTGNPREIFDHQTFECLDISTTETLLHKRFATKRIQGEWFLLDNKELNKAIKAGQAINDELKANKKAIEAAENAAAMPANSLTAIRKAKKADQDLLNTYIKEKEKLVKLTFTKEQLATRIKLAIGKNLGIAGIVNVSHKPDPKSIDTTALKKDHPEVHAKYNTVKTSEKREFKLNQAAKTAAKLIGEPASLLKKEKGKVTKQFKTFTAKSKKPTAALKELHAAYLTAHGDEAMQKHKVELIETLLVAACGKAKGVEGLYTYESVINKKGDFDKDAFFAAEPKLAKKYTKPQTNNVKYEVLDYRPYAV